MMRSLRHSGSLAPAGGPPLAVPRPRLLKLLAGSWKVAVVSAPAGYGKTTLASQVAAEREALWCRLAPDDREISHLLGRLLVAGTRLRRPVGARTLRLFESRRDLERDGGLITASLLDELVPLRGERLVVLDDVHVLAEAREAMRWLGRLMEESGPRVRFLLTCRGACPLPLARLELAGGSVQVRAEDLEFTLEEGERLFRAGFRLRLAPRELAALREAVGGWAAGLVLAAHERRRSGRLPLAGGQSGSGGERKSARLVAFLDEEVFAPLPERLKRALCRASLLDDLDRDSLCFLLGKAEMEFLLAEVARRDLFLRAQPAVAAAGRSHHAEGGAASFHPLFREVLERRMAAELGAAESRRLRKRLIRRWTRRGEFARGIRVLLDAGDRDATTSLFEGAAGTPPSEWHPALGPLALELLRQSGAIVGHGALPARSPWVLFWAARELSQTGSYAEAIDVARAAQEGLLAGRSFLPAVRAFHSEAVMAVRSGRYRDSIRRASAFERRVPARERAARGLLAVEAGDLLLHAGQPEKSRNVLVRAERLLRGTRHQVELAKAVAKQAGVAFTKGCWDVYLQQVPGPLAVFQRAGYAANAEALLLGMAEACIYLGEEDRALDYLAQAQILAAPSNPGQVMAAINRARAFSEIGHFQAAARQFTAARRDVRRRGSPMTALQLEVWSGILERRRGRLGAALARFSRAIGGFSHAESPSWLNLARMESALVRGIQGQGAEAMAELEETARVTRRLGDRKELARNALFEARVRQVAGDDFGPALRRALRALAREKYLVLLRKEADVALPLLAAMQARGLTEPLAARAVAALPDRLRAKLASTAPVRPVPAVPRPRRVEAPRVLVRVRLLGDFEVQVGERTVDFQRRTPVELIAYLALHRRTAVTREVLAEALWPGAPAAASRNRVDVTLHRARRALEPESGTRGPFRILVTGPGLCRLGSGAAEVEVDVEEFERRARMCDPVVARLSRRPWSPDPTSRAEAARDLARVKAAVAMYGGELLPGVAYARWTQPERERLRDRCAKLHLAVGALALAVGRIAETVQAAQRLLAEDPLEEAAMRLLLRALTASGKTASARKAYRRFARRIEREFGAAPSPETAALARDLLGAGRAAAPRSEL